MWGDFTVLSAVAQPDLVDTAISAPEGLRLVTEKSAKIQLAA
jgi:hypothetical protein